MPAVSDPLVRCIDPASRVVRRQVVDTPDGKPNPEWLLLRAHPLINCPLEESTVEEYGEKNAWEPRLADVFDEIILFRRLGRMQMGSIVKIQLQRVEKLLADRQMSMVVSPDAMHWLGERGYDPVYGARPLKRVIQKDLTDNIARQILEGSLKDGDLFEIGLGNGKLEIGKAKVH